MSEQHEVWFAIPSASVERCRERLPAWRELGYHVAILQNQERGEIPADIVEWSDTYPGWGESINILCARIVPKSASIVVSGGDDMLPEPTKTAQELAGEYFERFPDGFGVMQPAGDGFMWGANYCGSPWFARPFFESMNRGRGPMHGGYRHNWADYELFWVSRCMGCLWMRDDVLQYHAHFTRDGVEEETPTWWTRNVADADRKDCELFLARKYRAFPGHEPVGRETAFDEADLLANEQGVAEWKWNRAYAPHSMANEPCERLENALASCAERGITRVAIYGTGTHTRRAVQALAEPPVEVACFLDDNEELHGTTLWGFPVVAPGAAEGIGAIICSSDSFEHVMAERVAHLAERGVAVVTLYDRQPVGGVA